MKKFIMTTLAACLAAGPVLAQSQRPIAEIATPAELKEFNTSFLEGCVRGQSRSALTVEMFGKDGIAHYCGCLAKDAVKLFTAQDILAAAKGEQPSPRLKRQIDSLSNACLATVMADKGA